MAFINKCFRPRNTLEVLRCARQLHEPGQMIVRIEGADCRRTSAGVLVLHLLHAPQIFRSRAVLKELRADLVVAKTSIVNFEVLGHRRTARVRVETVVDEKLAGGLLLASEAQRVVRRRPIGGDLPEFGLMFGLFDIRARFVEDLIGEIIVADALRSAPVHGAHDLNGLVGIWTLDEEHVVLAHVLNGYIWQGD